MRLAATQARKRAATAEGGIGRRGDRSTAGSAAAAPLADSLATAPPADPDKGKTQSRAIAAPPREVERGLIVSIPI